MGNRNLKTERHYLYWKTQRMRKLLVAQNKLLCFTS